MAHHMHVSIWDNVPTYAEARHSGIIFPSSVSDCNRQIQRLFN